MSLDLVGNGSARQGSARLGQRQARPGVGPNGALEPCADCDGAGSITYWYDGPECGWQRGTPLAGSYRTTTETCRACCGDGVVESEVEA